MLYRFFLTTLLVIISGCGTTAPFIKSSSSSHVNIQHTNFGTRFKVTPEMVSLAANHCGRQGKSSKLIGIIDYSSQWGWEEYGFRCISNKELQPVEVVEKSFVGEESQQAEVVKISSKGSGFFISKEGHVITNAHVVANCDRLTVGDNANKQVPGDIVFTDRQNDLALLKLSNFKATSIGMLRAEEVRLGEKILVAGYPFGSALSNTIKITTGIVSATSGLDNDSGQFQLDAAVQPGSSGGPIYDSSGNIIGVVVSQLDKLKMVIASGVLPENVNFGIKASTIRQFLVSSGFPLKKPERTEDKSTEQLAEIAKNQALMVMCHQDYRETLCLKWETNKHVPCKDLQK